MNVTYERRIRLKLCIDCGGNRDAENSTRCRGCRRRKANYMREQAAIARESAWVKQLVPLPEPSHGLLEAVEPPPPREKSFRPDYRNESLDHLK